MDFEINKGKLFAYLFFRYPEARAIQRKIIFHSGPTNSGKTYHAIQKYLSAKSGVYCGPLKLLAHEIFEKSNAEVSVLPNICSLLILWGERVGKKEGGRVECVCSVPFINRIAVFHCT